MKRLTWLVPAVLIAFAYRHSLEFGILFEPQLLNSQGNSSHIDNAWHSLVAHGISTPFTTVCWSIEQQLFGTWAGGFHLVQVAWHILGATGVMVLSSALGLSTTWALISGMLYGLNPAAVEPVCLLIYRADVVGATALIWSFAGWIRWRDKSHKVWLIVHLGSLAIAIMALNKTIIAIPALTLWWATSEDRKWKLIAPAWLTACLWLLLKYTALAELKSPELNFDFSRIFATSAKYLHALAPLRLSTGVRDLPIAEATSHYFLIGAITSWLLMAGLLGWASKTKFRPATFLWSWLTLALMSAALFTGYAPGDIQKYHMADHWLLPASGSASILTSTILAQFKPRWVKYTSMFAVAIWSLTMVGMSSESHNHYRSFQTLKLLQEARYQQTPVDFRTAQDQCRAIQRKSQKALENRRPADAEQLIESATKSCQQQPTLRLQYVEALFALRQSRKAQHTIDQLLKDPPDDQQLNNRIHFLAGVISFENGYPSRAIKLLNKAAKNSNSCDVFEQLGRATASLKHRNDALKWYEKTLECQTNAARIQPSVVVAAAYWNVQSNKYERAKQLIEQAETLQLNGSQKSMLHSLTRRLSHQRKARP